MNQLILQKVSLILLAGAGILEYCDELDRNEDD